jgi:hypothetical protein
VRLNESNAELWFTSSATIAPDLIAAQARSSSKWTLRSVWLLS